MTGVFTGLEWYDEPIARSFGGDATIAAVTYGGYDVHVLSGSSSRELLTDVSFRSSADGLLYKLGHSNVDAAFSGVRFEPVFVPATVTSTTITGHGVEVDVQTGVVTAISPPPSGSRVHNFLLRAIGVPIDPLTQSEVSATIRVHVHDGVAGLWLTPSPLTIYRDSIGQRFTVLAELTTIGQPVPPMICDLSRIPGIAWSSPSPSVSFRVNGEVMASVVGDHVVTATLPSTWGGASTSGDIRVVNGWGEAPTAWRRAVLRAGPGSQRLTEVRNVLLVAEGFTASEEGDWNNLAGELINEVGHWAIQRPFDLFVTNNSFNVWSVFLPSSGAGSTINSELRTLPEEDTSVPWTLHGELRPRAKVLAVPTDPWDLSMLFERVGLPVRGDAPPNAPADRPAAYAAKLAEWQSVFGAAQVPGNQATFELWLEWAGWWRRTLADDRDTALGLAYGSRPGIQGEIEQPERQIWATFHPLRTGRAAFNRFLETITDGDGPTIGHVWAPRRATHPLPDANNDHDPEHARGKDAGLVIALVAGGFHGGVNAQGKFGLATASLHSNHRIGLARPVATSLQLQVVPHPIPRNLLWGTARIPASTRSLVVHELCHALELGDEYGKAGHLPATVGLEGYKNLTPQAEAQAPSAPPPSTAIDGNRLRWRWPRIAKAAVLSDPVWESAANEYVIPLRRFQKSIFAVGDIVYLRQRPIGAPGMKVSPPLRVSNSSQTDEQIIVERAGAGPFDIADYRARPPREAIVYVPVPAPAYALARGELHAELCPLVVRDHLTSTGRPLNRTTATCVVDPDLPPDVVRNLPAVNQPFWVSTTWVGAFDGGADYFCGVYHASPNCIMRHWRYTEAFCPVCAYLLVDAVDPFLFGAVDELYAPGYVEPAP